MSDADAKNVNYCLPDTSSSSGVKVHTATIRLAHHSTKHSGEMISLEGGWFVMGADDGPHPEDGEGPARQVFVDPFRMSATTVTNQQYQTFASETGYQTVAERQGWSFVFHLLVDGENVSTQAVAHAPWWRKVSGANWQRPFGGNSTIHNLLDHPVVHLALPDTIAYCEWANASLPTEAQWEFAARGGLVQQPFPWGGLLEVDGKQKCNVWKGEFPDKPENADTFTGTIPANAFEANAHGLYNMSGNVWEWTQDRFTNLHSPKPTKNPKGPLNGNRYVAKGGSYLCHDSYCKRYRTSSRQALDPMTTTGNVGFRVSG